MKQHTQPCAQCPWTRKSAQGYLGNSTVIEFVEQAESGCKMPCHVHIDYERSDWEAQVQTAPSCAGHAIYMKNRGKMGTFIKVEKNENVFSNHQEFIDYHGRGKAGKFMLIGVRVMEMK